MYSKGYYVLFSSVCLAQGPFSELYFSVIIFENKKKKGEGRVKKIEEEEER